MSVAGKTEEVTVTAETPLIDVKDSGVGEIITGAQIENLPLNGRQFGNLAALVPGVSLGFHTDPTKSTQFAPQVAGGGGRNINYLIDGGDNNDDTVGGLVQNFPLDSIGEFNFQTQRFRADTGRANGGTLKVVTKSGTNELRGSAFGYFRDKGLNSQHRDREAATTSTRATTGAGSTGRASAARSAKRPDALLHVLRAHQQDTTQAVSTQGLFPDKDGVFALPVPREHVRRQDHAPGEPEQLPLRALRLQRQQPALRHERRSRRPRVWGDSKNKFHSANRT